MHKPDEHTVQTLVHTHHTALHSTLVTRVQYTAH